MKKVSVIPSASLRHRRSIGIRRTGLLIMRTIFVEYDSLELYNWFIFSPSYCQTTRQQRRIQDFWGDGLPSIDGVSLLGRFRYHDRDPMRRKEGMPSAE
jgi:hypothetical protein